VQPPDARDGRAPLAAGAAQHATARPERGGAHNEGPEGGNGRATRGYRKQREQDRREHRGDIAVEDDFLSSAHGRSSD
jgi:hypothetical protein